MEYQRSPDDDFDSRSLKKVSSTAVLLDLSESFIDFDVFNIELNIRDCSSENSKSMDIRLVKGIYDGVLTIQYRILDLFCFGWCTFELHTPDINQRDGGPTIMIDGSKMLLVIDPGSDLVVDVDYLILPKV